MNNLEIINPDAISNCLPHFRGMRFRRERLPIFINTKEGEEVGAHRIILSASFHVFGKYFSGNDVVHVRLSKFLREVITAAVEYAYVGIENISPQAALRLYLLAHNLQNKALVDGCTKFLCARIEETNVSEIWSAANATKNEVLIEVCAPLVAMNWEVFRTSRLFYVTTEIKGMMSLLGCPQMSQESTTSKLKALLEWRNASRDDEVRTARTTAFRDMASLLGFQDIPDLIADLFVEAIDIPVEWGRWLAEGQISVGKQAIASSSIPSSSTEAKGQSTESQERLAIFGPLVNATQVCILNRECSEAEIEIKLPDRECTNVFTFQDKLVFIGDLRSKNNPGSKRVDLMDLSSFQVSSLPDMIKAKCFPVGVASENEIFIFSHNLKSDIPVRFSKEVHEAASERWSLLPPMIERRRLCAAVSIANSGVLVIGGIGRDQMGLRSTELVTQLAGEGGGGGGEKWQWHSFSSMNEEHGGDILAAYLQVKVYVVGCGEYVDAMEMLDVAADGQWTSLTSNGWSLC
ncbi:unnamed protein product [Hymenolepis diminuta]|uniref:BTB domain-containing protein n=1 Tax=Hymenolepis diminuta TaxID=6216 RepID=A0A564ZBM8_HYMDI|nr:unnamed protein product [Hymenolepis diminuta]